MGFSNPPKRWADLERVLSDASPTRPTRDAADGTSGHASVVGRLATARGDGGDSPAWSRKRDAYRPPSLSRHIPGHPYAELHAHSSFSFLDGASSPEELVEEAVALGLHALAITDHDGFQGAVRFAEAAAAHDLPTVFGSELSLDLPAPQNGEADPVGEHLLLLARGAEGYHRLSSAITTAQLAGEKGCPRYDRDALVDTLAGHVVVLTGCRKGAVRRALGDGLHGTLDLDAGARALHELVDRWGREHVLVELSPRPGAHRVYLRVEGGAFDPPPRTGLGDAGGGDLDVAIVCKRIRDQSAKLLVLKKVMPSEPRHRGADDWHAGTGIGIGCR